MLHATNSTLDFRTHVRHCKHNQNRAKLSNAHIYVYTDTARSRSYDVRVTLARGRKSRRPLPPRPAAPLLSSASISSLCKGTIVLRVLKENQNESCVNMVFMKRWRILRKIIYKGHNKIMRFIWNPYCLLYTILSLTATETEF